MENSQRYVSGELTHFVGRGGSQEEQYDILVNKILKSGWLTYPPHDSGKPRTAFVDFSKPISSDRAIQSQVVCFCDIPVSDISIHVAKYSKFGLAFRKEFLIGLGACPVFYVENKGLVPTPWGVFNPGDFSAMVERSRRSGSFDRALYLDTSVRAMLDVLAALDALCSGSGGPYFSGSPELAEDFKTRLGQLFGLSPSQLASTGAALRENQQALASVRIFTDFLLNQLFTFIKCFDAGLPFDDASNFYMEREWRICSNVQFQLRDVARAFFPAKYAERFRKDVPDYCGQISFID